MPISDHYARYEKLAVRIITVDTSTMRIEAVGKDAAVIQVSVNNRPAGFRWPIEGEAWIVRREGTEWMLDSKLEDPDHIALSDGEPGDLMGPDGFIPQHKTKATSGQGLVWTSEGWVPQNIATQSELDTVNSTLVAADAALDTRLDAIEGYRQTIDLVNAAPPWSLGNFDGENIQGVRLTMSGKIVTTVAAAVLWLKPNGLSTISTSHTYHRFYWDGAAVVHNAPTGADRGNNVGLHLASVQFTGIGTEFISYSGIFYTRTGPAGPSGHVRHLMGDFVSRDATTDGDRLARTSNVAQWETTTGTPTPVTSLAIVESTGGSTFSGRITTEIF
jgi:hypothetical protein